MATLAMRLTVEEFDLLPESDHGKRELVDGEVVEMPGAHLGHERVKAKVFGALFAYSMQHTAWTPLCETRFRLTPFDLRQPDVSLLSTPRADEPNSNKYPAGAPELAIEVVFSESAAELQSKVELYLAAGAKQVWVIYPDQRVFWLYQEGSARRLRETDILEVPDFLPGFSLPLRNIFTPQSLESPRP